MDKKEAIKLLKQALTVIPSLKKIHYDNQDFKLWRDKFRDVIKAGLDQDDYQKYISAHPARILTRGHFPDSVNQKEYVESLARYETVLKSIIRKHEILAMKEKRFFEEEDYISPIELFNAMRFHPRVVEASKELFEEGNYRNAIYRAFVETNKFVKRKARSQLDGKSLMSKVFRPDNPIIKLNPLETQTDRDDQEGFMYLFMGAMQGIRNSEAHPNITQSDPYKTLEYLGLASLLMKRIEDGKVIKLQKK
jgi:uncharacterized protein (TIGR02391 family)